MSLGWHFFKLAAAAAVAAADGDAQAKVGLASVTVGSDGDLAEPASSLSGDVNIGTPECGGTDFGRMSLLQVDLNVENDTAAAIADAPLMVLGTVPQPVVSSMQKVGVQLLSGSDERLHPGPITKYMPNVTDEFEEVAATMERVIMGHKGASSRSGSGNQFRRVAAQVHQIVGENFVLFIVFLVIVCIILCVWLATDEDMFESPYSKAKASPTASQTEALLRTSTTSQAGRSPMPSMRMVPSSSEPTVAPSTVASSIGTLASGGIMPPPVCPSLILPHTEARFIIKLDALLRLRIGSLDIKGTSGRTLLQTTVWKGLDGRRALSITSVCCTDDPRVMVMGPARQGEAMEVLGKGGSMYGTIESTAGKRGVLRHKGEQVMTIETADPKLLKMAAFAADNRKIGVAQPKTAAVPEEGDDWRLSVAAGADAVLISACMLGMVLLAAP